MYGTMRAVTTTNIAGAEGPKFVKFLSSSNDSKLNWRYAQIIFPASFGQPGGHNKDATMARWSKMTHQVLLEVEKFEERRTRVYHPPI